MKNIVIALVWLGVGVLNANILVKVEKRPMTLVPLIFFTGAGPIGLIATGVIIAIKNDFCILGCEK